MPWLLRCEAYDTGAPGVTTLYFSDVGVTSGAADTPAHTYWKRRIDMPPTVSRSAWSGGNAGGRSETGFGTITLANQDGALDALAELVWDGHEIEVLYTAAASPVIADFSTVLLAVSRHVTVGDVVEITIAERSDLTELPYQSLAYAGTGDEEGDADWEGVRKPKAFGICWQVEPDLIDEANLVYAYHAGGAAPIGTTALRDRGVALIRGGNHANYAALLAASFFGADYVTCTALGLVRLSTLPSGPLTMDLLGQRSGGNIVTNPEFTSNLSSWTAGTGWAWGASPTDAAYKTAGSASVLEQTITTTAGAWYAVSYAATRTSGTGVLSLLIGGVTYLADALPGGDINVAFQATASSTLITFSADSAFVGYVAACRVFRFHARAGEIMQQILVDDTSFTTSDIDTASIAALDAAQGSAIGIYSRADSRNVPEVLDLICQTVGAFWTIEPTTGKFTVGRFEAPGTPDHAITYRMVHRISPRPAETRLRTITVNAARRWRPLDQSEIAGAVADVTRRSLEAENYPVTATHADTETEARTHRDETVDSLFAYPADAQDEADRRAALFGPQRFAYDVECDDIAALALGDTVLLTYPRWVLTAGRAMRVLRIERDGRRMRMTLTLWG